MMCKLKNRPFGLLFLILFLSFPYSRKGLSCSGYKITKGNRTFVGCNHDTWFTTPHIWFENSISGKYGAAFTGARFDGANGYAPQSGMNTMGLAFERLASSHPFQKKFSHKKKITNPTKYLKDILHSCKSVEEVAAFIRKYDFSYFLADIFIYVDKSGKYLIVEPYTLTIGHNPTYVISNFCPSITDKKTAHKLDRYRNGVSFLKNGFDTTLSFCKVLSDTMHVCRNKIGDGTLISSIWDLKKGVVNLYFYHDYNTTVQFNLIEELEKGNHILSIESLFPFNKEFEKLKDYKTPKNSVTIALFIIGSAGFFLLTSVFFLIQYFRRTENKLYPRLQLLLFPIGIIMFFYMIVLCGSVNVYYFPAPYKDPTHLFITLTSYIPFLLILLILPFTLINYQLFKNNTWGFLGKWLFTINNVIYLILIGLFTYWKFYDIFN